LVSKVPIVVRAMIADFPKLHDKMPRAFFGPAGKPAKLKRKPENVTPERSESCRKTKDRYCILRSGAAIAAQVWRSRSRSPSSSCQAFLIQANTASKGTNGRRLRATLYIAASSLRMHATIATLPMIAGSRS
jgi:hypothetical protein